MEEYTLTLTEDEVAAVLAIIRTIRIIRPGSGLLYEAAAYSAEQKLFNALGLIDSNPAELLTEVGK